jgi:hypothetical protein
LDFFGPSHKEIAAVSKVLIYEDMTTKIELKADIKRLQEQVKDLRDEMSRTRNLVDEMREYSVNSRSQRPWRASPGQ